MRKPVSLRRQMKRLSWYLIGVTALVLGAIGVIAPVLPTTPFVILSAFAFAKCSPKLHSWLMHNRTFGPIILDWRANGAIAPRYKALALAMMACAFVLSIITAVPPLVLVVQAFCMIGAASFILTRPNAAKAAN